MLRHTFAVGVDLVQVALDDCPVYPAVGERVGGGGGALGVSDPLASGGSRRSSRGRDNNPPADPGADPKERQFFWTIRNPLIEVPVEGGIGLSQPDAHVEC